MAEMKELILNFHGVGEPPSGTEDTDMTYWCDEAPFLSTLDAVVASKQTSNIPIKITFDDGNISDVRFALPALKARPVDLFDPSEWQRKVDLEVVTKVVTECC